MIWNVMTDGNAVSVRIKDKTQKAVSVAFRDSAYDYEFFNAILINYLMRIIFCRAAFVRYIGPLSADDQIQTPVFYLCKLFIWISSIVG